MESSSICTRTARILPDFLAADGEHEPASPGPADGSIAAVLVCLGFCGELSGGPLPRTDRL